MLHHQSLASCLSINWWTDKTRSLIPRTNSLSSRRIGDQTDGFIFWQKVFFSSSVAFKQVPLFHISHAAPMSGPFLRHKCYVIKCIRLANSDCNSHCKLLSSIVVVVIYTVNDDGECNLHCTQLPLVHNLSCYQISYFITDHWSQRLWTPNFKFWISNCRASIPPPS